MEELRMVLCAHSQRYPLMETADVVKLIYQNEFGGGHLITDEEKALAYLRREYDAVPKSKDALKYESIGNGIFRVNLAAVEEEALYLLGKQFIQSAALHHGSLDRFYRKLAVLREMTRQGKFLFDEKELEKYLAEYEAAGCPAVSHSEAYRRAYGPAYRVILKDLGQGI